MFRECCAGVTASLHRHASPQYGTMDLPRAPTPHRGYRIGVRHDESWSPARRHFAGKTTLHRHDGGRWPRCFWSDGGGDLALLQGAGCDSQQVAEGDPDFVGVPVIGGIVIRRVAVGWVFVCWA